MNHLIPFLFNFALSSLLIFLLFFLLVESLIALFRIKCYRLIYWLRLLPFLKLSLAIFNYSGSRWLHAFGQTILQQPDGSRNLGISVGLNSLPFFEVSATAQNDLYFGIGDILREFIPPQFPLHFLLTLGGISLILLQYYLYQSLKTHLILRKMLKETTLLQTQPIPIYESTSPTHSPLLTGIRKPFILFPHGLKEKLTKEEFDAVIRHERSHLLWKDHLTAPLLQMICLIFWFIPFLKYYYKRLELTREIACDQTSGHSPSSLTSALCKTTRHLKENHLVMAISFGAQKTSLAKRIDSVLNRPRKPLPKWKKIVFSLSMAVLTIIVINSSIFPF